MKKSIIDKLQFWKSEVEIPLVVEETAIKKKTNNLTPLVPEGRISENEYIGNTMEIINKTISIIKQDFLFEVIPKIRKLSKVNPDISQALQDLTQLANTGHKIKFDPGVTPEEQAAMRLELEEASKNWGDGIAGINGLVNKMISQLMIAGAISNEWIPNRDLQINPGINTVAFLKPENIRWGFNKKINRYEPFQKVTNGFINNPGLNLIKLNKNTYKYYALNGDEDLPYGTPPYLAALGPIATQEYMVDNIKFIVEMIGLMGHMEVKLDKPDMQDNESDKDYQKRLEKLLLDTKTRVKQGFRDGISTGFSGDHEFTFHSTTKSTGNVEALFSLNELLVASGLKYDAAFLGRGGTTETMVTILFTKMLSQLTNIQNILSENLKFGYALHLRLKGFKFKHLDVEFNKSTITDDLKNQQAREIKQRIARILYADGIISQNEYADIMGYKKPDQAKPRVPIDPNAIIGGAKSKTDRKDQKDRSARKTTDKKKSQGTIKDKSKKL